MRLWQLRGLIRWRPREFLVIEAHLDGRLDDREVRRMQIMHSLLRRFHPRVGSLHLRSAELEFGNLAEWIERRIREDIRGRFHVSEGDKDNPIRDSIVLARIELNGTAPRGDALRRMAGRTLSRPLRDERRCP